MTRNRGMNQFTASITPINWRRKKGEEEFLRKLLREEENHKRKTGADVETYEKLELKMVEENDTY